ncbi:hypothetical protein AWW69_15140 [Bacillus cereus]|nr:hypothetical protein AWW69_15140 [Bacillus cereus]
MEQQLIHLLLRLIAKAGGESLVRELMRKIDDDGYDQQWTEKELRNAIQYLNWQIEHFGTPEASAIVESLIARFGLDPESFTRDHTAGETGVKGLM